MTTVSPPSTSTWTLSTSSSTFCKSWQVLKTDLEVRLIQFTSCKSWQLLKTDDDCVATLHVYLDIINLFQYILQILASVEN